MTNIKAETETLYMFISIDCVETKLAKNTGFTYNIEYFKAVMGQ